MSSADYIVKQFISSHSPLSPDPVNLRLSIPMFRLDTKNEDKNTRRREFCRSSVA